MVRGRPMRKGSREDSSCCDPLRGLWERGSLGWRKVGVETVRISSEVAPSWRGLGAVLALCGRGLVLGCRGLGAGFVHGVGWGWRGLVRRVRWVGARLARCWRELGAAR